ncbi:NPCBM/NEW2 domain-containing protein [Promicromonospora sp. Populi]|uniref:NPCBM/NEW2 domain-containing protein n=1 Tax=Promicromonospora sp. Populi TaxID=3239420 RepID=UPI0034E1C062
MTRTRTLTKFLSALTSIAGAAALALAPLPATAAPPPSSLSPALSSALSSSGEQAAAALEKLPLTPTPPMGWNSWNNFACDIDEELIRETADAMVASGMADAEYEYVNIDDCWMAPERDADGNLQADPERFPSGIKALADYVHAKGLKLGIYSSAGTLTCQRLPASLDHEEADAAKFAEWEVDLLKYDNCNNEGRPALERYTAMAEALLATGRPIVFSICEWGESDPWASFGPELGHLWRTTGDISDNWGSVTSILDQQVGLEAYSGPNAWNDPDMLEVGNGGMTTAEYRSHMALWSVMNAPLIAGNDLRDMDAETLEMLTDPEVVAVNQDWAGIQGHRVAQDGDVEVWAKPLSDGGVAAVLLNRSDHAGTVSTTADVLGLDDARAYSVRDLWDGGVTETRGEIRASVPAHGSVYVEVKQARPGKAAPLVSAEVVPETESEYLEPGTSFETSVTVTNLGTTNATRLSWDLAVPAGWSAREADVPDARTLRPGRSLTATWQVSVGDAAAAGLQDLAASLRYTSKAGRVTADGHGSVRIAVPPSGTAQVSDLDVVSSQVGWGELGLDESTDGNPITIGGVVYAKGLGAHANSEVVYYLGGHCTRLTTDVGVDDEVGDLGSVTFTVVGDGEVLAESGVLTGADGAATLDVDTTGVTELVLLAGDADGSISYDHSTWAAPELTCA